MAGALIAAAAGSGGTLVSVAVGYSELDGGGKGGEFALADYGYANAANDLNSAGFGYPVSATLLGATINALMCGALDSSGISLVLNGDQRSLSINSITMGGTGYTFGAPSYSGGQTTWSAGAAAGNQFGVQSSQTATMTIASPCVVTATGNILSEGSKVMFKTTGALPTGLAINTVYYVLNRVGNTFNLAATLGGSAINTSGSQSGVHTLYAVADCVVK